MKVLSFVHEGLGNSSHLVQITPESAVLVDPDRSVDRYLHEAEARGLRIAAVLETHLHADFVTGSRELLELTGIEPHASRAGQVRFPHQGVNPGDAFTIDGLRLHVIGSPGHTPEHVSYVLRPPRAEPPVLFSGGSLIVGGAARTDLVSPAMTEGLTHDQFRTLKTAFADLPDETVLHPTHGGGSFCSAGSSNERVSTLGRERATNPLLQFSDEGEFTNWFPSTFPGAPDYFFKMRPINQSGPRLRHEIADPEPLSPEQFRSLSASARIIDVRPIHDYLRSHIPGALSIAFRPSYSTWLGWLVSLNTPLLLVVGDHPVDRIVEESLLVGHENFAGSLQGGMEAWADAGFPVRATASVDAEEARGLLSRGAVALDVREPSEFLAGHLHQAINIPLGNLPKSSLPIPTDPPIIIYCGHGERSTTGASLLERNGVEAINLTGGFEAWPE